MTATTTGNAPDPAGVNHPAHYNVHPSGVECIRLIRELNFDIGNAVKYVFRAGLKDGTPSRTDLEKARWYLRDHIFDGDGEFRSLKLLFGDIRDVWAWNEVVVTETDELFRRFYLAILRSDLNTALRAVEEMLEELQ